MRVGSEVGRRQHRHLVFIFTTNSEASRIMTMEKSMCNNDVRAQGGFCRVRGLCPTIMLVVLAWAHPAFAQISVAPSQPLITQPVNEANLVTLASDTPAPAKNPANDRGIVPDSLPMDHMLLQLRRPAAQEQALDALIDQLYDRTSSNYHRWLSPDEFGRFGIADADIQTITGWLRRHGFTVNFVYPNKMVIDFSGSAAQVRTSFRTEVHYLDVNGATNVANMTDPQMPAALVPAVFGIVSLNNIPPRPLFKPSPPIVAAAGWVGASDLATIYNFNPLFSTGISGQGQTIYVIALSDPYGARNSTNVDWSAFRSTFGLSTSYPGGSLSVIQPAPAGSQPCNDPGIISGATAAEAILDAEWASAAAPSANIIVASCAGTNAISGTLLTIQNVINGDVRNGPTPPPIVSVSLGHCEPFVTETVNTSIYNAYKQGVAQGTSIFVGSGDLDADFCDAVDNGLLTAAANGFSVNAFASTPYNTAVGGTDFSDTYSGTAATYWSSTQSAFYGSAILYVPEIPWNDTWPASCLPPISGPTQLTALRVFATTLAD